MMNLAQDLRALEDSNLVRQITTQPELEYIFRHTLMQETAYNSLLRTERKDLHLRVGQVLEALFDQGQDDLAPLLAHHFDEAGETSKAVRYFELAGETARARYANQEASEFFARALGLAEADGQLERLPGLHRARGLTCEILGDFDGSRLEHEAALKTAQALGDERAIWQAYQDLGMLWSSKDYQQTQAYYGKALKLARGMNEPAILAHTLNRIGNLEVNVSLPLVSEARHQEALQIFESLGDERGIAETMDYLGMTYLLAGKAVEGEEYYREAARLFLKQGDELRLASTLATSGLRGASLQNMQLANTDESFRVPLQDADQAFRLAENIGWRSGAAFALFTMASVYGIGGEFGPALDAARQAIRVAEEIGHEQWTLAGECILGGILIEMLQPEDAIAPLKLAGKLADRSNSQHWSNTVTGFLASAWIDLNELETAEEILDKSWQEASGPRSLSEGKMWLAKVRLCFAKREIEDALKLIQAINATVPGFVQSRPVPRLGWLQGLCFAQLGHFTQAEEILTACLAVSQQQEAASTTWRILAALGSVQRELDQPDLAEQSLSAAEAMVETMAQSIQDPKLEHVFRRRAAKRIRQRSLR